MQFRFMLALRYLYLFRIGILVAISIGFTPGNSPDVLGKLVTHIKSSTPTFTCTVVSEIPQSECQALVDLYQNTNGATWTNQLGWLSTSTPCQWYGVGCSNGHVIDLNLHNNQVVGTLPATIEYLPYLVWLILSDNRLTGTLPVTLGNLSRLESLDLYRNQLTGAIPAGLGNLTNLIFLSLGENQLSGEVPPQLGNLTKLEYLYLPHNQFTGSLPAEIGQLQNLRELTMEGNQLQGSLPAAVGNLVHLTKLYLWRNQLTGTIPAVLGNLAQLQVLSLSDNQLSGPIPPELGLLTALQELTLSNNQLTGAIPTTLGNLPNLRALYLGNNRLTGGIPAALGNLVNLQHLTLYTNPLQGEIPPELGNLPALEELDLGGAGLTGAIPSTLGNLSVLQKLVLWGNQLQSSIPDALGNLPQLQVLALSDNKLTGALPATLTAITPLTELYLSSNNFTGAIPPAMGNLTNMITLTLSNNQFTGLIPTELGRLNRLQSLYLGDNQLTGPIPPTLSSLSTLEVLDLQQNQLSGAIPPQLGQLTKLRILHLGENQLSGAIPAELGQLTNLRLLLLWTNQLTGPIPSTLAQLPKLEALLLNDNQLQGEIPPWLGTLTQLRQLNLSSNQLTGAIPASLGNLIALRHLHLNHNQLTGPLPAELGNLGNLEHMILWVNQLNGPLPTTLGNLHQLTILGLSENQLSGMLPSALGNLTNLTELHLHTNRFTDALPTELGNLAVLQQLYLARNAFSGEVPLELTNLTQITTLDMDYNMLTTTDAAVRTFLDSKAPTWQATQTVPPVDLQVKALNSQVVQLNWTPPLYQQDHGGYQVSYGTSPGGPYTVEIPVSNKATSRFNIGGLTPEQSYFFSLRTYTPAHDTQQNDLWSAAGQEVSLQMPPPPTASNDYDDCANAKAIGMDGLAEEFSFQEPNDVDWVRFAVTADVKYRITVRVPPPSDVDVILELYDECTSSATATQDPSFSPEIRYTFTASQTGVLYLRLFNKHPSAADVSSRYELSVRTLGIEPKVGALIIVAGHLKFNDSLQKNIYNVTDRIYRLWRSRGYSADRIYYLAVDQTRDPSDDGNDDVDGMPTNANLRNAITTWATDKVGPNQPLTIYLVDHGAADQFFLDKPRNEVLRPSDLDAWLDQLSTARSETPINIIIEACESGSFISAPNTVSGNNRVVLTSTEAHAPAYGARESDSIIFSDALLDALAQGYDLYNAFVEAQESARRHHEDQVAWLDDNGNGLPNEQGEGVTARKRGFAFTDTFDNTEPWAPYVVATEVYPVSGDRREIRVRVIDDQKVETVWATVYPPSYIPPATGAELVLGVAPTQLSALGDDWFGADYSSFDESGTYRIVIFAEDEEGLQAVPVVLLLTAGNRLYLPLIVR